MNTELMVHFYSYEPINFLAQFYINCVQKETISWSKMVSDLEDVNHSRYVDLIGLNIDLVSSFVNF